METGTTTGSGMTYRSRIVDRQVGRNAELFARVIAGLEDKEKRYLYLRILVRIVEQAHPEWSQSPERARRIAFLVGRLSDHVLGADEVEEVVKMRDSERGVYRG